MHVPQNANIIIILGNKITLTDYVKLLHTLYGEIPRPVYSVCECVNCNLWKRGPNFAYSSEPGLFFRQNF